MNEPFHVLEWRGGDVFESDTPGCFAVVGFGRDVSGRTTSVRFFHLPSFLVRPKRRDGCSAQRLVRVLDAVRDMVGDHLHGTSGLVNGKPYTGWQDSEEPFLRLVFYTRSKMRQVGETFRRQKIHPRLFEACPNWFHRGRFGFETFELDADVVLQALTYLGVPPTGWVRVHALASRSRVTNCAVHYDATPIALLDDEIPDACAPHVIATFDIEVFSSRSTWEEQIFPESGVDGDAITQVCTFFSRFGESSPYEAESLVLLPPGGEEPAKEFTSSIVPVRVKYFRTEESLLHAWVHSYADHAVAVWCHFNGLGFDEAYLHDRCTRLHVDMSPLSMSRDGLAPRLLESKLESNAYGWNLFRTVDLAGVFHLDVHQDIKKNHNLESYSLDSCAEHFISGAGSKTGLKPQEQFECFASGKASDIERLTDYCCQDVALTYQLMERLAILPSVVETAAVSWVTPTYLVTRGQQIRVYSCIKREIYARGASFFLRDTKMDPPVEGGYKGATVLEPKRAPWFYPRAVISLDFASLYPSIMMQYNLSHETWSADPPKDGRFYHHEEGCGFARASTHEGILPAILIKLKASRKVYKRAMAYHEKKAHEAMDEKIKAHHAFMEKVFDAKQKATKVTMNSVYGFCGVANNGKQPCLPLASATTTIGRSLIEQTKTFCEAFVEGSEVIYGDTDSVMWNVWPEREVDALTVSAAFEKANETCEAIAPIFKHDGVDYILLEFENVYVNYLLLGKKNYATLQYSADLGPSKPKKTVKKGLRCVRRDTIEHARRSQSVCVEHITHNRIDAALEVGRRAVESLFSGEVPVDDLVMSKKVSSSYRVTADTNSGGKVKVVVTPHGKWKVEDDPSVGGTCEIVPGAPWKMTDALGRPFGELTLAQPHVHVMHKMEKRTPNGGPRVGERVRYVFVTSTKPGDSHLQISRAEDPEWVKEKNLATDACYYFDHALRSPLEAVLSVFVKGTCNSELGWRVERAEARNKADGQRSLCDFGYGVAASNAKPSRVARAPPQKKKKMTISSEPGKKGNIASFFQP